MMNRSFLKHSILALGLVVGITASAQIQQVEAYADNGSRRQAYLQEQEAFTKRLNLTTAQKTQYEALVAKRNIALMQHQEFLSSGKSTASLPSKSAIMQSYTDGLDAILSKEQRVLIVAEKAEAAY